MKGLDQGHLHPKLEVPILSWMRIELRPPWWEASTPENSHSNSLWIDIRNIYKRYEPVTLLPPVQAVTWKIEHTWAALGCRPNSTLASHSTLNIAIRHLQKKIRIFTVKQDKSCRGHHYEETDQGHCSYKTRSPKTYKSWQRIGPGPPW